MGLAYLRISLLMMRAKPVRASLSLLGIFIGVLALIIILSIREGIALQIADVYHTEGAHVIFVYPGYDAVRKKIGHLNLDDLTLLQEVRGVLSVTRRLAYKLPVKSTDDNLYADVIGVDERFVPIYRIPVIRGRSFLPQEADTKQAVCLLTAQSAAKLFPVKEPLGATVDIRGVTYRVIGVVDWNGRVTQRTSQRECDVLVPLGRFAEPDQGAISSLEVRIDPRVTPERSINLVKESLSRGDPDRETLFFVRSLEQQEEHVQEQSNKILLGLLGIAAISLLVGGIGIANVMITTVTERTREIGIRKALGARRIDILMQFLVESCVLTVTGGALAAIIGGMGISLYATYATSAVPLTVPLGPVLGCLLLTLAIGLLAGVYPASRAAALNPADALRYE